MCSAEPNINGRPVLQPTCNRVRSLDGRPSLNKTPTPPTKKKSPPSPPMALLILNEPRKPSPPVSPKLPSPRPPAVKRGKDSKELSSSGDYKVTTPSTPRGLGKSIKKPKKQSVVVLVVGAAAEGEAAPGSIAAARREQVAVMQEQRKMRIAHYGRTKPSTKVDQLLDSPTENLVEREQKRCSYITPTSDPVYVAYHDEEWGVPVHDDKLLFELLVLTGAQVGSDWTSVLKKRETFRDVFSGFDAEAVAKYNEKKMVSISADFSIELGLVRGAVDNAIRILEIKKGFGSFAKYLWAFVNHKPISTQYKLRQRIPVKTSKSESISKDMVRRGFRFVGPTTIHAFIQAAGLTNDHLITCPRHLQCVALAQ